MNTVLLYQTSYAVLYAVYNVRRYLANATIFRQCHPSTSYSIQYQVNRMTYGLPAGAMKAQVEHFQKEPHPENVCNEADIARLSRVLYVVTGSSGMVTASHSHNTVASTSALREARQHDVYAGPDKATYW
jgi:hypothetical protein